MKRSRQNVNCRLVQTRFHEILASGKVTRSISAARLTSCSFNPGLMQSRTQFTSSVQTRPAKIWQRDLFLRLDTRNLYILYDGHCVFYSLGRGINMTRAIKTPERESHKNFPFRAGGGRKFGAARKESQTHSPSPLSLARSPPGRANQAACPNSFGCLRICTNAKVNNLFRSPKINSLTDCSPDCSTFFGLKEHKHLD
jgi:hypothetical protein